MIPIHTISRLPKIELHVHLEGAIQPATLFRLAEKNNIVLPVKNIVELQTWYKFKDFAHFIEVYFKICECICSAGDIEFIAKEFLTGQKKQHIIYSEIIYTPYTHFTQHAIPIEQQIKALDDAKVWAEQELDISCNYILDISRQVTPEQGKITAQWVLENQRPSIRGLGLGGPEKEYPPEIHREAFERLKNTPYASLPHAGETAGPASVWGAIKTLGARRIGHGVRSIEDPVLIDYIIEHEITLDVCPTSNICLNVYDDIKNHPLPDLVKKGVKVTINSDDPPMFSTSLTNEYKIIADTFGFTLDEIRQFNHHAIDAAVLNREEKEALRNTYDAMWGEVLE